MIRLLPMIMSLVATDVGAVYQRKKRNAVLYAVVTVLFGTAWLCAVAALVIWAAYELGAVEAALVVAAGLSATALITLAIVALLNRRDRLHRERTSARPAVAAAAALAILPAITRSKTLLGLAGIAGLVFAATQASSAPEGLQPDE